ncbi:hypothetical protein ACFVVM_16785 [Nocardia sp. NPDC058176]|uniref:hypothetical protein n=1 Tax=Nocardia sp. NPDC058176 TaxID=3346368 RepID=UPI0036DE518B
MYTTPTPAVLASSLHQVFAGSTQAPDSLALWLEIAAKAVRELELSVRPDLMPWVPLMLRYRLLRTEGEFFPYTGSVRIMTGPLTGTLFPNPEAAAEAVVAATPVPLVVRDEGDISGDDDTGDDTEAARKELPLWRFRPAGASAAFTPRAVPPLIS